MKDKIYKLASSTIKIRVEGRCVNKFLSRLIKNKINIYKVIPLSYKEMELIINYKDLDKILKLKSIYNIKIIKYYGKLRLLKLLNKNTFIIIFLLLGIVNIYILSNIIFSIEVIHSNKNIINLVNEELKNNGIRKYHFVKSYKEIEKIKKKILEDNKDSLEWLEIIREGTKYTVRVEERIINKENSNNKIYDIVASKNAVIKNIYAESGEKIKNINTYVKQGEVIISSDITLPNNEKTKKSSKGTVLGEVWYMASVEYPYVYNEVIYTGNKKKVLTLNFFNKRISFFDFNKYKSFNKNTKYIFNNNIFPISLTYEYIYETKVINEIYTYDTAKEKAISTALEKLSNKYSSIKEITDVKIISEENKTSKIVLDLFITCNEDITEYKEIDYNN